MKLNTEMTAIAASQTQSLPSYSWQNDAGLNGPNGPVYIMTTYDGELIVGGEFTAVGGVSAKNIASWDGTRWKSLGAGVNSFVRALEVYEGDLIVGGNFTQAGGVSALNLARWDGSSWEQFGGGANNTVYDLLASTSVSPDTLFACGDFTWVGGTSAGRIARWDGSAWHTVGSGTLPGLNGPGLEMMEWGDRLVVTGLFTYNGRHYIFHWLPSDPDNWHIFGEGLLGYGSALERNSGGFLIVGGGFTQVCGFLGAHITANRLAYWAGSWWSSYGAPGLDSTVNDLLFDDGGTNLYVAGGFTTAGGINASRIAQFATGPSTWDSLGSGVTADDGVADVMNMCFYSDELIAGGRFDSAGGVAVGNIARWDGSLWHALSYPLPVFSIGLAVGRFDADSELDDIAITACATDLGYVRQYLRVYGVDTLAALLTLSEKGETNLSGYWTDSELARSRRLIAIDDITGNGQANLVMLSSESYDGRRIDIYEPCDIMNNCTFNPMPQAGSWVSDSANLTQLVLADLDSATIELGPPTYYVLDSIIQPLVILNVPPVHYDILNGTDTANINDRCPWPPGDAYDTYCAYGMFTDSSTTITSVIRKDWGISAGLDGHISGAGATVKAHLSTEYGEGFTATGDSGVVIHTENVMENHAEDLILAAKISYDVWEYPVYREGQRIEGGDVVVINPRSVQKAWMQGRDVRQWIPDHEVDNILSYPSYGDPANNPMVATENVLTGVGHLMAVGNKGHWVLTKQVMTTNGYEEASDFGVEVGASIGYEGGMKFFGVGFKYGFEVSVEGTYDASELNTYSTTVANKDSIHVQYNSIFPSFYTATYNLTPYAYWSKNGALVLDYYAEPAGSWWTDHYTGVDPAFILPWRYDPEKYRVDDNEQRYQTKEIVFIPNTPSPGDTVLIIARVHNFGLNPIADPVKVSFYFGDPYTGGHILYDKNTGDSVFYTCDLDGFPSGIGSRSAAAAQMVWSVPADESIAKCQLIYALIDPFDEISPEIHDNGDTFSNNKGWKLLRVNTTTECYDPDGDTLSASAYECCDTKGDNCPNVYNPNQEDTDDDGIGDACEDATCGDANGDMTVNVGDAVYLINYIFKGGPAPVPLCAGDANGDAAANVGDAVYLITYIFKGGPAPVEGCCP